jgi:photosystem II stability/assembly factor-like uncharacterized protein
MKIIKVVLFIFLLCNCINAQWVVQQVPTTKALINVYFADTSKGWLTGRDGIFHTTDGGYTWEQLYQGNTSYLSGLSDTELWATTLRDTLLHTTNGGIVWDIITINSFTDFDSTWSLSTVYFYNNTIGWIQAIGWKSGSYAYRLLKTIDGGTFWEMRMDPWLSSNAFIQFIDSTYGYRTGSGIPFFRTTDGGDTWEQIAWYGYMYTFIMQFLTKNTGLISIDGPVLTTSVIKTTNGGENWSDILSFQCSDLSTYLCFIDTLNGWVVQWTCLYGGRTEIWNTSNGGSSWDLQFTYSPPFYFDPRQIFFVDSLHGWVIGDKGVVLHTSTGGIIPVELISFTAEVVGEEVTLNWTTATETNNQGFEIQRSESRDHPPLAEDWEKIGYVSGYGTTTEPKSYSFIDTDVYSGNYKYRMKQLDYDGTFSYSKEIELNVDFSPQEFMLYQNYPNPFNSSTVISYQLPLISNVTLKVYDILGNELAILVNEEKQPGVYSISFDASTISSGIYLYQLKTGAFVHTNKMILTK